MSNLNNDTYKKTDQDSLANMTDIDNDEKSYNEASTGDDCSHETVNKKRKLIGQKIKSVKRTRLHNSSGNGPPELEAATVKDLDSDSSSHKYISGTSSSPMQIPSLTTIVAHDIYCWICLKTENTAQCSFCPRSFHTNCIQNCFSKSQIESDKEDLICPECISLMVSECTLNIVTKWKKISVQQLNEMLLFILMRLYHISGSSHFQVPVDDQAIKDYYTIIKHPVYLDMLKEKVMNNEYSSVQAFHSDFKWILHNCSVYNGVASVLTNYAKNIDKVCMKEINFLRSCPECFQQRMPYMIKFLKDQSKTSPTKSSLADRGWDFAMQSHPINEMWMTKLCGLVHCLVWVRLHNYPVWPGKLISLDEESALVLFFGDYDLNIVPLGSICIHTQSNHKRLVTNIANFANRRASAPVPSANSVSKEYQLALDQLNIHLDNVKKRYDFFVIPPKKIEFNILAGVEYYDAIRLHDSSMLSPSSPSAMISGGNCNDVIIASSIKDSVTGFEDDVSELDFQAGVPSISAVASETVNTIAATSTSISNISRHDSSKSLIAANEQKFEESASSPSLRYAFGNGSQSNNDCGRYSCNEIRKKIFKTTPDLNSRTPFLKSLEMGMQSLLRQLKYEYLAQCKLMRSSYGSEDWAKLQAREEVEREGELRTGTRSSFYEDDEEEDYKRDFQQQTEFVAMANASVQFSNKELEKEEELRNYVKYLEKCLVTAEIEIRRQEILSAIHHEESMLELSKQQKEMKKIYDNDVAEIIKVLKTKLEENVGRTIQKVKLNEWCAFCTKLARFYCCWNTCYCNHECQSKHWELHKATCTQINRSIQPGIVKTAPYSGATTTTPSCNIPSMMQHMFARNGESDLNGGPAITDYVSASTCHKQRLPLKR